LPRERSQIDFSPTCGIEGGAKRVPQALEQVGRLAQLLRMVLAKKSEKTGSTACDSHFGHLGWGRFACSAIVSVCENTVSQALHRYS